MARRSSSKSRQRDWKGRRGAAGFTLIEILVVVVIVGLIATIAVVNMGSGSQSRDLENSARKLFLILQTASDQAVLENEEIGVVLDEHGYELYVYNQDKSTWDSGSGTLFQPVSLPDWVQMTLHRDQKAPKLATGDDNTVKPDLMLFSSSETTPFKLTLQIKGNDTPVYTIRSDGVNGLEWVPPEDNKQ